MNEDFLHYVWKFQKFDSTNLKTTAGDTVVVLKPGMHNHNSGPDFFNSQIRIAGQHWAGNIEIHLNSSHWFAHGHETDIAYDSVILHVVWEHDAAVFRNDKTEIPTLELKYTVDALTLSKYKILFSQNKRWIPCETDFHLVEDFIYSNWLERLYIERLEHKLTYITEELENTGNDWEAVLFRLLCKNFGLQVNGDSFYSIATSVDFSVVRKCTQNHLSMEAVLMGQAGFLSTHVPPESLAEAHGNTGSYYSKLRKEYHFLKGKFGVTNEHIIPPKFFRLRPPNFPTIRLSQLAVLYVERKQLFSDIISARTLKDFYKIFNLTANVYWDTHFNFGSDTSEKPRKLTHSFINLLLINTVLPIRFCHSRFSGATTDEEIIVFARSLKAETNTIIKKFDMLRPKATNAMETQGLLQLKNKYCDSKKCLQCAVGNWLLKQ